MSYRIGVFGIGTMGLPISCNFLADGNQVTGYDISPKAIAAMKEHGIEAAGTPRELMERYGERVVSRLQQNALVLRLHGRDLRAPRP